jgi:putative cardiolipin synthase
MRIRHLEWMPRLVLVTCLLLSGCASLPEMKLPEFDTAATAHEPSWLGDRVAEQARSGSGVMLVDSGIEALRHRHALIASAERTIDAQYYIWNSDTSGRQLVARLVEAADRGVHVRLLIDDFSIQGRDIGLRTLDSHPRIDVRIFNPVIERNAALRWFSLLADINRISRRMHNKALIVDEALAVIGGRNIGDEYFDLDHDMNFRDRDLLVAGPAVSELATGFSGYWNHPLSIPVTKLVTSPPEPELFEDLPPADHPDAIAAGLPTNGRGWIDSEILPALRWSPVEVLYERPGDAPGEGGDKTPLIAERLSRLLEETEREVLVESAYLVLRDEARSAITAAVARGIEIRALTNSLASNDVLANHAGYAKHRAAVLQSGVELHEMRPDAAACRRESPSGCGVSPRYGLHSKSVVFDERTLFVGSFNLNPRSTYLNTELVLIVHDAELARQAAATIETFLDQESSWRLALDARGRVVWQDAAEAGDRLTTDPGTSAWRRLGADLLGLLPGVEHF